MTENTTFAESLREARAATGMSQQKMADRMLISKRNIEKWETGERTPPPYVQRSVLNELAEWAPDKPLTLDELRKMHGQPVYCPRDDCWGIVKVDDAGYWKSKPFIVGVWRNIAFQWDVEMRELELYRRKPTRG